jgi:hypothetical protein
VIPEPARALATVGYLEARKPEDPGRAWELYKPMLLQAGDDETARKMYEVYGDLKTAAVQLGGIEAEGGQVRIGGIALPVRE